MKTKKRILMLNYEFPPLGGGAANATYYILKEFSKKNNIKIDLVTSSITGFQIEKFSENINIHFLDIGKGGDLHYQSNKDLLVYSKKAFFYSKNLIQKNNFDLLHAFFGIPCGYIAFRLNKKFKIPYIVSLRGSDVPKYNERYRVLDKVLFKRLSKKIWRDSKYVVANSQGLKDLALETSPDQDIKVIPNGIDIEEFSFKEGREERKEEKQKEGKEEKSKKRKKETKKIKLISTGRLIPRKGFGFLIDVLKDIDGFELTLVGDGPLYDELKEKAKKNGVLLNLLGKVNHDEIPKILQNNDIFILPSLNEGMSNAILEAMACGLPIVTTDTGGSKELVKDNGFVFEKNDFDELKEILNCFKEDTNLISKMGNISRKKAEKMSWENVADQYIKFYE